MPSEELSAPPASAVSATPPVAKPRRLRTFESLQFRDFRLLWLGMGGTSMGQWMDQVARGWLIYQITGSPLQLGAVSAMRAIPMLFFGVVAGVVADRYGRKAQLVIAQVVNIVINVILATLVLTGQIQPWHVYVTALFAGTVQAFQQPARQSLISDLVGREHLANAVALNSAIFNLMRSVGPAVAGGLIAVIGVDGSYYAQALLYAWATLWTVQMTIPGEPPLRESLRLLLSGKGMPVIARPSVSANGARRGAASMGLPEKVSMFGDIREGFRYLLKNNLMLSLMTLGLAPVLLGMPYTSLMPVFALDVLHVGSVGQGFLLTATGVGALVGALFIASLGSFHRKGLLLLGGATAFGLCLVAFSQSLWMPLSLVFLFFAGMSNASYTSQDQTIIQTIAPKEMRGRIISIYMLNRGLMPLGSLLAGALADWLGGPTAVLLMGFSCAIVAVVVAIRAPRIRELEI